MKKSIKYLVILLLLFLPFNYVFAININSFAELENAITNNEQEINIESDFEFNSMITISNNVTINGKNHKLSRSSGFTSSLFAINNTGSLELHNITIDGGSKDWQMDIANAAADSSGYFRANVIDGNNDILATQALIINSGNLKIKDSHIRNTRNNASSSDKSGGAIRSNAGTLNITNTNFTHNGTYREGGAVYITGGTAIIKDSTFESNAAGVGYKGRAHGGAIHVNGANSVEIDNTIFKDNFAQHNGGAIMLQTNGSDLKITNSNFKNNSAGNDGSVLSLESTNAKHSIIVSDSVFDSNTGLATTGQSMGTVWIDAWKNDSTMPAVFKNLVFKNNHSANGSSFASYGTHSPYCVMDNIESYNNRAAGVGSYFLQSGTFIISNANIHDNTSKNGGAIASAGGDITVTDSIIKNNTALQRGGGPIALFGKLTIKDSEITNNYSKGYGGGIAAYSMYASYGSPELHLENVLVKDNTADISGGGLSIQDTGNAHSTISVDDASKIYDNKATIAADDVFYSHANASSGASTTLDNIAIAGLLGIDGWYLDPENDRFKDTDNPTVFNDFVNNDGSISFYLKAAGISNADYDGNGGSTNALPVTIKYGSDYIVDDDIPVREGYTFKGWNTASDGSGTTLKAGDSYNGKEGFILYAMWEKNKPSPIIEKEIEKAIENPETVDNILICLIAGVLSLILIMILSNKKLYKNN